MSTPGLLQYLLMDRWTIDREGKGVVAKNHHTMIRLLPVLEVTTMLGLIMITAGMNSQATKKIHRESQQRKKISMANYEHSDSRLPHGKPLMCVTSHLASV